MTSTSIRYQSGQTPLPPPFRDQASRRWQEALAEAGAGEISASLSYTREVEPAWAFSDFVGLTCKRHHVLFRSLLESDDLHRHAKQASEFKNELESILKDIVSEEELGSRLRLYRKREMVRIAWRDLVGLADLFETMADLTRLAEACLTCALNKLYALECGKWGMPHGESGMAQSLVVIGMGKIGAGELNFSSDIDLIFAYPETGRTRGASRSIGNDEFFAGLARRLIRILSTNTEEGFVFRVDMRLRPYGENGPLVMSFDGMEEYYQSQGRDWERYAWIKARVLAGDKNAGDDLLESLRPFVFRRYLDFGAFDSLRSMKELMVREAKRQGLENNIKLGAGGIREIEFIGQAFQLLWGGRVLALRNRRIMEILRLLAEQGYLPPEVSASLQEAYIFLRCSEHRLQEFADKQTHDLPVDDTARLRLSLSMGFASWEAYNKVLRDHMCEVHAHFASLFHSKESIDTTIEAELNNYRHLWETDPVEGQSRQLSADLGFQEPQAVSRVLKNFQASARIRGLSDQGRMRLDRLMPRALRAIAGQGGGTEIITRFLSILEAIAGRISYLALLNENPAVMQHLLKLIKASPIISDMVSRHPLLLDELLDSRTLYAPPDRMLLAMELRQRFSHLPEHDIEQNMEELRSFKQINLLRVAAADVTGGMPIMKVSDHLTFLAEVILEKVLHLAWNHLAPKHGIAAASPQGFAVLGYGKLGGIELGYDSDLDLVFLRADIPGRPDSDGELPDNTRFFNRLGQRLIHILTAHTANGVLYPIDMRLRPDGGSGLLMTTIDAFAEYQATKAWTWEHQALVRARAVAGDPELAERFADIRRQVLSIPRDPEKLRCEVVEMRQRLRAERDKTGPGLFDLKNGPGGIVDIEFMVQYLVLLEAHRYPELCRWSDNVRLLETMADCGLLSPNEAELLREAYLSLRTAVHRRSLQKRPAEAGMEEFRELRAGVIKVWQRILGEPAD